MRRLIALLLCTILITTTAWAGFDFRDEFTTARATGAVNGSAAEPGPGTRYVPRDTGTNVLISDGKLTVDAACSEGGDPFRHWGAKTREPGLGFFSKFSTLSAYGSITGPLIGLNTSSNPGTWQSNEGGFLSLYPDLDFAYGSSYIKIKSMLLDSYYESFLVLRSGGTFSFVKSTDWKMLWSDSRGSTATLYYSLGCLTIGREDAAIDYIRIPSTRWLPTPLVSDGFSAATSDGLGHAETTGLGSGGSGVAWTDVGGTWTVSGGVATNSPSVSPDELLSNITFSSDTGWTKGSMWTVDTGDSNVAEHASGSGGALYQDIAGKTWLVGVIQLVSITSGNAFFQFGAYNGLISVPALSGTYTVTNRSYGTSYGPYGNSLFAGTVDNVSLRSITTNTLFRTHASSTPDILQEVKLGANPSGKQAGLITNLDSTSNPQNYIIAYYDGTNIKMDEFVAGAPTNKISSAYTWAAGTILRLIRDGTEARLYVYNGTLWAQVGTTQTMAANTGTIHGLFSTGTTCSLDNYVEYARGTSGEYSILDALNSKNMFIDIGSGDYYNLYH